MAIIIFLFTLSSPETETLHLGRVYFDMTDTTLTRESETVLKIVANKMHAEPNLMIDVYGYTYGRTAPNVDTSGEMAERVKSYLADNFAVLADRIQTPGYTTTRSLIQRTETEAQWVDVVVRRPDAILTLLKNDVKVQPPALRPNWLDPLPDYYLYHGYKVTTGKKSSANILYPGKGMLRMDEDAMVIIHSLSLRRKEEPLLRNLKLQEGSLTSLLEDATTQTATGTSTKADKELASQIQDTVVAEKLEDLVVVYQRNAEVTDLGREPVQQTPADTAKDSEGVTGELGIPPAAPTLVSPGMNETKYYPNEITFVWQPSGVLSHLQVAEDSLFEQIAFDAYAASESLVTALAENLYYWRVSGINTDSLEGDFTDYWTFVVEVDTLKPQLEIAISRGIQKNSLIASGRTEVDAELFIDDEEIKTDTDGSFSYTLPGDQYHDHVIARAIDPAGNITEKSCRIPGNPMFVTGINAGMCLVTNDKVAGPEKGFWYGVRLSRMLWPSVSLFTSASIAMSNGKTGDILNMTDIVAIEIGLRKNFYVGRVSPFLHIQSGFAWSQMSMARQTHPGIINYSGATFDPTIGFGAGGWFHIGGRWYLNLHADYMHVFRDSNDSDNTKTFTRIGFGIQDRML